MDVEGAEGIDADGNCTNTAVQVILSADYPKVHVQTVYHTYIDSIARIVTTGKFINGINVSELENVELTKPIEEVREDLFRILGQYKYDVLTSILTEILILFIF
jgi:hypothetical protein